MSKSFLHLLCHGPWVEIHSKSGTVGPGTLQGVNLPTRTDHRGTEILFKCYDDRVLSVSSVGPLTITSLAQVGPRLLGSPLSFFLSPVHRNRTKSRVTHRPGHEADVVE